MPPHYWIPMRSSDQQKRKRDVIDACDRRKNHPKPPKMKGFFERDGGGQFFALVEANDLDDAFFAEVGKNGDVVKIHSVD